MVRYHSHKHGGWLLVFAFLAMTFCGCSGGDESAYDGPTGSVKGKLLLKGKPAPEGTLVSFYHKKLGATATGVVGADGTFQPTIGTDSAATQIPTGDYEVAVTPGGGSSEALDPDKAMEAEMARTKSGKKDDAGTSEIPQKYADHSTSGIVFEVKKGENTFEYDIKD